jgi:pimeloyl-ACP methyl ester carboxylesterase
VLLGVLIYSGLVFGMQRQLLYPGQGWEAPYDDGKLPINVEQLWLDTSQGPVESWLLAASGPGGSAPGPALVLTHGNGEFIGDWVSKGRDLAELGLTVLLVEFPGFGRSAGSPSEDSITETMLLAWEALAARPEVDMQRIVAFGRSLGGGAACVLARERPVAAIVLQSAFTGVRAFASQYFMPAFAVLDPFDNEGVLSDYQGPVLVLHGADDGIIPVEHGRRLAQVSASAELVIQNCRHNDCPPDWPVFVTRLERFLQDAGLLVAGG